MGKTEDKDHGSMTSKHRRNQESVEDSLQRATTEKRVTRAKEEILTSCRDDEQGTDLIPL